MAYPTTKASKECKEARRKKVTDKQAVAASPCKESEAVRVLIVAAHSRRFPLETAAVWTSLLLILVLSRTATAAKLKPETVKAWDEYVLVTRAKMQERLKPQHPFLSSDEDLNRAAKLRTGEILVSPAGPDIPERVPSGLIHDWSGEVFISNTTLQDVLLVVRGCGCYKDVYRPVVINSTAIAADESVDQFSLLLMNKSLITKTALDGKFRSTYFRVDDHRWYSVSESTRIQEIAGYGAHDHRTLPEGEGIGLTWRTFVITGFEERDGGVYMEMQAIVLSRDIPIALGAIFDPLVRRVSRESLITYLRQTKDAVHAVTAESQGYCRGQEHLEPISRPPIQSGRSTEVAGKSQPR